MLRYFLFELSEKRTFSAFPVIRYAFLYYLTGGVVILRKAVYAENSSALRVTSFL